MTTFDNFNAINMRCLLSLILLLGIPNFVLAQSHSPFSHTYYANYEKDFHALGVSYHTSIKPYDLSLVDSVCFRSFDPISTSKTHLFQFLNDNLLFVETADYALRLNPLMHFEFGNDNGANKFVNSRGAEVKGRVGSRLRFYSAFHEKQLTLPSHVEDFIFDNQYVLPGQGMVRKSTFFNDTVVDLYNANAYVNYQASSYIDVELGHGKHFFGDGYRSLLLSDNSFNYPYFKITTQFWRLKYVNLFSSMQHLNRINSNDISQEKMSAIHYLSANVGNRLTINLFESIMLGEDSLGHVFDINYLNPVIFYRPVEYSINYSRHGNAIIGLGMKYKLTDLSHVYGQLILDEFTLKQLKAQNGYWANKYGGQIGFKWFDVLGYENLTLQSEVNIVRPFTYSHKQPILNYAHYAQPLAHPYGASFVEHLTILRYRKDRWSADLLVNFSQKGGSINGDSTNYGNDIFVSYDDNRNDFGNDIAQGNTTELSYLDARIGYLINPTINLKFEVGLANRVAQDMNTRNESNYFFISLKTDLSNIYYDF